MKATKKQRAELVAGIAQAREEYAADRPALAARSRKPPKPKPEPKPKRLRRTPPQLAPFLYKGLPRFTVGSLTGYIIHQDVSLRSGGSRPATFWYVQDRAYGSKTIGEYRGGGAEKAARALAAKLNGEPS